MFKLKKIFKVAVILLCISNLYSSDISKTILSDPDWSFSDNFEGDMDSKFWITNGLYAKYGAIDPTDSNNKVFKFNFIPNSAGGSDTWAGHDFKIPIDAVQIVLSWKQYIPANYTRLRNFQNFFTLWSGSSGMRQSNISLGSSLWGRYSSLGSMASIRAGIDGIDYGHNMNSNKKLMLKNNEGKWVNMYVYIELAKDSNSFGKMNIFKDGELITGTDSNTLQKAYGGVPEGKKLIQYSTRGNYIDRGKLFGWASGSFDETVSFLIDDFKILANSTFKTTGDESPKYIAQEKAFVDFEGAKEDQVLVDTLIDKYLSINDPKRIIYVAPFIEGSTEDGSGKSKDDPRRNLKETLENALPGDHIYLAPGVYRIDKERDNFGRKSSQFYLNNSGTLKDKIVVRTDPSLWDPKNGAIAQIDFGFDNSYKDQDKRAIGLYGSNWVFEDLEIRNFNDWGFYISGKNNIIRNNNIHHCNHPASNNTGLIVIVGSGKLNNLVVSNHLHHSGRMDDEGNLLPLKEQEGLNGGCTYTITRQHYESYENLLAAGIDLVKNPDYEWKKMSWEEMEQYIAPSDDEAYYYNNLVDHCFPYGMGTKNEAEGKFYFLSNIIHSSKHGMKLSLSHIQVQNNIIYKGEDMEDIILYGATPNGIKIIPQVMNAVDIKIKNNTFVGANTGIVHKAGWNGVVSNNIFLDISEPHYITHNYYNWALVAGEYLYGDLDLNHPYFDKMPLALQDQVGYYKKLKVQDNIYITDPILKKHVNEDKIDYLPSNKISDNYTILDSDTIKSYLIDPENNDFRINKTNAGVLEGMGSGIQ